MMNKRKLFIYGIWLLVLTLIISCSLSGSSSGRRSSDSGKGGKSESSLNNNDENDTGENSPFDERGLGALGIEDPSNRPGGSVPTTIPPTPTITPVPPTPTPIIIEMPYDFTVTTFDGDLFSLADHRGKVVVINFWAHWCSPCRAEADEIQEAWEYYSERGDVIFLGMTEDVDEKEALEFIEEFGLTFPNAPDEGKVLRNKIFYLDYWPTTFIIDKSGELVFTKIGSFSSLSDIISTIDSYLE